MTECITCGAQVVNMTKHTAWHDSLRQQLGNIAEAARRYVEPPRYK